MPTIRLPNNWTPRFYQLPLWEYFENGGKRGVAIWHRRAGKDDICLHLTACSMIDIVGTYWHMLPEASQARKAIWEAVNPHTGIRRIDEAFPKALRATTREQDMFIKFKNGSTWQVLGSDNYNSLVGSPPIGVVLSEWALCKPDAWAYLRPILLENGGWAFFISTPRGDNHCKKTYNISQMSEDWFGEILTVDDTKLFTEEQLKQEKLELIEQYGKSRGEALYNQEYYCSWSPAYKGKSVYNNFSVKTHMAPEPLLPYAQEGIKKQNRKIIRCWDNTGLSPAVIITYINTIGQWFILKELCFEDTDILDAGKSVLQHCSDNFPGHRNYLDIGDPAGRIRDTRKKSPAIYLADELKINIMDGVQTFRVRVSAVNNRLTSLINGEPAIVFDPEIEVLKEGFLGGYCYPELGSTGIYGTEPIKNKFSHPHDALQYGATVLFELPAGSHEYDMAEDNLHKESNPTTGY